MQILSFNLSEASRLSKFHFLTQLCIGTIQRTMCRNPTFNRISKRQIIHVNVIHELIRGKTTLLCSFVSYSQAVLLILPFLYGLWHHLSPKLQIHPRQLIHRNSPVWVFLFQYSHPHSPFKCWIPFVNPLCLILQHHGYLVVSIILLQFYCQCFSSLWPGKVIHPS